MSEVSTVKQYNGFVKPEPITLVLKSVYPKVKRKIFCMYCGGLINVTYKQIAMIIHGAPAESEVIEEIHCYRCKQPYAIC